MENVINSIFETMKNLVRPFVVIDYTEQEMIDLYPVDEK